MKRNELEVRYPWIRMRNNSIAEYIPPSYYDSLLKSYIFSNKDDLEYFSEYLKKELADKAPAKSLELGSGTGRGTDVFLNKIYLTELDLVDMSLEMVEFVKKKYCKEQQINVFKYDSIDFLNDSNGRYDFVFSLWSLSHSIHQHMVDDGLEKGTVDSMSAIEKFIVQNMNFGSKFYLIHFDSMSDEQRILIRQWEKFFPIFSLKEQSPSKRMIDRILTSLESKGMIKFNSQHLVGNPINYSSLDEALETFVNFHMEMEFNGDERIGEIINELECDMRQYRNSDGSYSIKPGCFVYSFEKII